MNHTLSYDELERICVRYRATNAKDYRVGEDIDSQLQVDVRTHLKVPATSRIVAVLDSTVRNNFEYGLAICDDLICWTNPPSTRSRKVAFSWDELVPLRIVRSDRFSASLGMNVDFGEGSTYSNAASDFPTPMLVELLQVIQFHACKRLPAGAVDNDAADAATRASRTGWSLSVNGVTVGPYDQKLIHTLILANDLDPDATLAWRQGMKDWEAVTQIVQLQPKEVAAPPPLPGQAASAPRPSPPSRQKRTSNTAASTPHPIEINTASRDDLLGLPYMTLDRIKAVEAARAENSGLTSVEELGKICSLKPHEVERLRARVVFRSLPVPSASGAVAGKRVVDF